MSTPYDARTRQPPERHRARSCRRTRERLDDRAARWARCASWSGQFGGLSSISRSLARALRDAGATVISTDEYEAGAHAAAANRFGANALHRIRGRSDKRSIISYFGVPTFESIGGRHAGLTCCRTPAARPRRRAGVARHAPGRSCVKPGCRPCCVRSGRSARSSMPPTPSQMPRDGHCCLGLVPDDRRRPESPTLPSSCRPVPPAHHRVIHRVVHSLWVCLDQTLSI